MSKKGTFQDTQLGLISGTITQNRNARLKDQIAKVKVDLKKARSKASKIKSTMEKLKQERDFHKFHQN